MAVAVGSDGNATMGTGFNAALNTWSAQLSRSTQVITAFNASSGCHNRRASSVLDITGSAGGFPIYDNGSDSDSDGSLAPIKHTGTALNDRAGASIQLYTSASSSIAFAAVFSSFSFGVAQDGASTVTFNFEMNQATAPTVSWDES